MHWEAIGILSAMAIGAGIVLLIPGLLLGRWLSRRRKAGAASARVTRAGAVFYTIQTILLFLGFACVEIMSGSWGISSAFKLVLMGAYALVFTWVFGLVDRYFRGRGVEFLRLAPGSSGGK